MCEPFVVGWGQKSRQQKKRQPDKGRRFKTY